MSIGVILRGLRGSKSLQSVANDLQISKSALAMYEQNRRIPRDEVKIKISQYYHVPVEEIFYAQKEHETCS